MGEEIRLVNRAIGLQPKLGPFAFYQVIVFFIFLGLSSFLKELLGFSWAVTALLTGSLTGTLLALLGNRPWLFWSKLVGVPHVVRGGTLYIPLLSQEEENFDARRKCSDEQRRISR